MPILIGLVLAPLGAIVGIALFLLGFVGLGLFVHGKSAATDPMLVGVMFYGMLLGSVFAAPVTVIALPAAYAVLRRRSVPTVAKLTLAGALLGFSSVWIVTLLYWKPVNVLVSLQSVGFTLLIAADGAAAGAVCGNLLGRAMRSLRPQDWHGLPGATQV
jgi:hypothetical protein